MDYRIVSFILLILDRALELETRSKILNHIDYPTSLVKNRTCQFLLIMVSHQRYPSDKCKAWIQVMSIDNSCLMGNQEGVGDLVVKYTSWGQEWNEMDTSRMRENSGLNCYPRVNLCKGRHWLLSSLYLDVLHLSWGCTWMYFFLRILYLP